MARKSRTPRLILIALVLLGLCIAAAAYGYFVVAPSYVTNTYLDTVGRQSSELAPALTNLSKVTQYDVFSDPTTFSPKYAQEIAESKTHIATARQALANIQQNATSFKHLPYTEVTYNYGAADSIQRSATFAVLQSEQAINEYDALLRYLDTAFTYQQAIQKQIDYINGISNFDTLAGGQGAIKARADSLRYAVAVYDKVKVPEAFDEYSKELKAIGASVQAGLDQLSSGLYPPVDNTIYSAVAKLEAATKRFDKLGAIRVKDSGLSPAIVGVSELPEKLDALTKPA